MITLKNLGFDYGVAEDAVLRRLNLRFEAGEFALVCGPTGSGKSTLLKTFNGLCPHFTGGNLSGEIWLSDQNVTAKLPHELADGIGYVNQQPDGSFVADTVAEEIAFGLEQLGVPGEQMQQLVNEVAARLGLSNLLSARLEDLSGGEQQRVAIASALVAGQRVLVLDEPTSALDPAAAHEVLSMLKQLTREHGITVILAEHRIERVLELVDSVTILHGDGTATKASPAAGLNNYRLVPPLVELAQRLGWQDLPVSMQQAKATWQARGLTDALKPPAAPVGSEGVRILEVSDLSVRYGDFEAVAPVDITFAHGELTAIMGPNGSGKSSLLWAILGLGERTTGTVRVFDRTGRLAEETSELSDEERLCLVTMVPQSAADLLFLPTLRAELEEADRFAQVEPGTTGRWFSQLAGRVDPEKHPRDLSAGQQLALVLAMQIGKGAGLLLLDEPTRGLDYQAKRELAAQLGRLKALGRTVILASHDVEFVALVAERVVRLENGRVVSDSSMSEALGPSSDLATQIAELVGVPGVVTVDQAMLALGGAK